MEHVLRTYAEIRLNVNVPAPPVLRHGALPGVAHGLFDCQGSIAQRRSFGIVYYIQYCERKEYVDSNSISIVRTRVGDATCASVSSDY